MRTQNQLLCIPHPPFFPQMRAYPKEDYCKRERSKIPTESWDPATWSYFVGFFKPQNDKLCTILSWCVSYLFWSVFNPDQGKREKSLGSDQVFCLGQAWVFQRSNWAIFSKLMEGAIWWSSLLLQSSSGLKEKVFRLWNYVLAPLDQKLIFETSHQMSNVNKYQLLIQWS